ncbi:hypothetical protein V6N13_018592 [Hibiscus sabdariffa]|uniref:Uncharacterized protein n=1 Tax=Hibiscus sabdariffa TaxID=183260 RepID=A0ABR2ENX9_9ROSI
MGGFKLSDETAVDIVFRNPRAGIARRLARVALQEVVRKREIRYGDTKRIEKGIRRRFMTIEPWLLLISINNVVLSSWKWRLIPSPNNKISSY